MESNDQSTTSNETPKVEPAKKSATPNKLPSKPISFGSGKNAYQNGKKVKTSVDTTRKSSFLMKKLTGK